MASSAECTSCGGLMKMQCMPLGIACTRRKSGWRWVFLGAAEIFFQPGIEGLVWMELEEKQQHKRHPERNGEDGYRKLVIMEMAQRRGL